MNTHQPLIFIGDSSFVFEPNTLNFKIVDYFSLHFLVIKDPHDLQLKMLVTDPASSPYYSEHDDLMLHFMKDNGISKITTNGGGWIGYNSSIKTVEYGGRASVFGPACNYEIVSLSKIIWPSCEVTVKSQYDKKEYHTIDKYGSTYFKS